MKKIRVCCGKKCTENGSPRILEVLAEFFKSKNEAVDLDKRGCTGYCELGPNVVVDDNFIYHNSRIRDIAERIEKGDGKKFEKLKPEDLNLDELL